MRSESIFSHSMTVFMLVILLNLLVLQTIQTAGDAQKYMQYVTLIPTSTSTPTPTPTVTRTPIPTPTPTKWIPQAFDPRMITFTQPGGGGGSVCAESKISEYNKQIQAGKYWTEFVTGYLETFGFSAICAFGFPRGEPVTITLYTPDYRKAAELPTMVDQIASAGMYPGSTVYTDIYRSLSLPQGRWRIVAQSKSRRAEGSFVIGRGSELNMTVSHDVDSTVIHPRDPRFFTPFSAGEVMVVKGAGFKPYTNIPLGFYLVQQTDLNWFSPPLKPIMGEYARTDRSGNFTFAFPLDKRFQPGNYIVVPLLEPIKKKYFRGKDIPGFQVISPKVTCNSSLPSRINIKQNARLTAGKPNNVRQNPGLSGSLLGQVHAYEDVYIQGGPECRNGLTWWNITTADKRITGWTAEGDAGVYWLLPLYR